MYDIGNTLVVFVEQANPLALTLIIEMVVYGGKDWAGTWMRTLFVDRDQQCKGKDLPPVTRSLLFVTR